MTHVLSRRSMIAGGAALLPAAFTPRTALAAPQPVLLELFTSQGCSSCPPADRLVGDLSKRADVIAVSLNVDYWDYLGWRDTLARPEYSERQRDYAQARGDGEVYTPQVVANGRLHAVGSSHSGIEAIIADVRRSRPSALVALEVKGKDVRVDVKGEGAGTVWLMAVAASVTVDVARGENAGSSITYHNVVRHLTPAGMWKGGDASFTLPRKAVIGADCSRCIAVVQEDMVGPVLGLAQAQLEEG